MRNLTTRAAAVVAIFIFLAVSVKATAPIKTIQTNNLKLVWELINGHWKLAQLEYKKGGVFVSIKQPSGAFTLIYSQQKPPLVADESYKTLMAKTFVEGIDKHAFSEFNKVLNPVSLNTAGIAETLVPDELTISNATVDMLIHSAYGDITSHWELSDKVGITDIRISYSFKAAKSGYYAIGSPCILETKSTDINWATIPGYFQGDEIQSNFALAYAYGNGIPDKPVIYRDRCATSLTAIISRKDSITVSAISAPEYGRDPWLYDKSTQNDWHVGLSVMNRQLQWSPTLYYPVLGEYQSQLDAGQSVKFDMVYTVGETDWFSTLKHGINDVYDFHKALSIRKNTQSLSERVFRLIHYLSDDSTSLWRVEDFNGVKLGGQSYMGGVAGSNNDAIKNSDYGAMWMVGSIDKDQTIKNTRLPYAKNFKLLQQQTAPGFFEGAAIGQYYLYKSKRFTEEWGNVVEPIGLTYYTMLDIGNMLLFNPGDKELLARLRMGADQLLNWQHADGSFEVAYDRATQQPKFTDVKDLRSTFYGLLVAYKLLKDPKYLAGAKKGADWYLKEGINKGSFLGVCGDVRYIPDFATAQSAQAYLDLYDITKDVRYKDAAIIAAKIYVSSIYTYPLASTAKKIVNGKQLQDWQITQAGLSFEHGGNFGSATTAGPILLASHAGMFIRMYQITGESLFLDMARTGAIGRDAFLNKATSVASYYWANMDRGAGPFPHHAWWQIGWIMDYLLSEINLRSAGQISFPRGFVTPKVGPHQSYGFAPGKVYGNDADLKLYNGLVKCDDPNIEFVTAMSKSTGKIYIILINDLGTNVKANVTLNTNVLQGNKAYKLFATDRKTISPLAGKHVTVDLKSYGLKVLTLQ